MDVYPVNDTRKQAMRCDAMIRVDQEILVVLTAGAGEESSVFFLTLSMLQVDALKGGWNYEY